MPLRRGRVVACPQSPCSPSISPNVRPGAKGDGPVPPVSQSRLEPQPPPSGRQGAAHERFLSLLTLGRNFLTATTSRTCRSEAGGGERGDRRRPLPTWTPPASLSTLLLFGLHRNGANKPFFLWLESMTLRQSSLNRLLSRQRGAFRQMPKPSTTLRGYGYLHQQLREKLRPMVEAGMVCCARCGRFIEPGQRWELDHAPGNRATSARVTFGATEVPAGRSGPQSRTASDVESPAPTSRSPASGEWQPIRRHPADLVALADQTHDRNRVSGPQQDRQGNSVQQGGWGGAERRRIARKGTRR